MKQATENLLRNAGWVLIVLASLIFLTIIIYGLTR